MRGFRKKFKMLLLTEVSQYCFQHFTWNGEQINFWKIIAFSYNFNQIDQRIMFVMSGWRLQQGEGDGHTAAGPFSADCQRHQGVLHKRQRCVL